jgi:hypothetical protein
MKIECLLRRPGGTKVTLERVEYHFKPGPDGREFADVTNSDHIGIFASIREGYRVAGAETKAPEPANPATPAPKPDPTHTDEAAETTTHDLETLDRAALSALHFKKFGRYPAPRLSAEKIIEALREG